MVREVIEVLAVFSDVQLRQLFKHLQARHLIDRYECGAGTVVVIIGLNVCRLSYRHAVAFARGVLQAGEVHDIPFHEPSVLTSSDKRALRGYTAR